MIFIQVAFSLMLDENLFQMYTSVLLRSTAPHTRRYHFPSIRHKLDAHITILLHDTLYMKKREGKVFYCYFP